MKYLMLVCWDSTVTLTPEQEAETTPLTDQWVEDVGKATARPPIATRRGGHHGHRSPRPANGHRRPLRRDQGAGCRLRRSLTATASRSASCSPVSAFAIADGSP